MQLSNEKMLYLQLNLQYLCNKNLFLQINLQKLDVSEGEIHGDSSVWSTVCVLQQCVEYSLWSTVCGIQLKDSKRTKELMLMLGF